MNLSKTALQLSFFMVLMFGSMLLQAQIPPVEFYTVPTINQQNNTLRLDINVKNYNNILSQQFTIVWNEQALNYKEVTNFILPISGPQGSYFGTNNISNGTLTFVWFDPDVPLNEPGYSLSDCSTIFSVEFDIISSQSPDFDFGNSPTLIEVYESLTQTEVDVIYGGTSCLGTNGLAPFAACEDFYVQDPTPGCVTIQAADFNAGSWDDFDDLYYLVAKKGDSISPDEYDRCYYPSLEFCDDEPQEVEVFFLVFDQDPSPYFTTVNSGSLGCNGTPGLFLTDGFTEINYDVCESSIKVCNSPVPVALTCPSPQSIACELYYDDLEVTLANMEGNEAAQNHFLDAHFGEAEFDLPCDFGIEHSVVSDLNQCGEGNLVRTWTAYDLNNPNGNSAWCSQVILLHHISDFVVEFDEDKTLPFGSNTDPDNTGYPKIFSETCELIAVSWEDMVFNNEPGFDKKVLREFTVINWCAVGAVIDNEIIEVPESQLASPNNDLDGDGDSDDYTFRDSWDGIDFPGVAGDVWDGYIEYTQTIYVEEPPVNTTVPYCVNGLVVEIMQTGVIELWATDLDAGSWCNGPGTPSFSFSPDVNDQSMLFTCDELGFNQVELWVTCGPGNQDFCTTFVIVEDNMSGCGGGDDISISGQILQTDDAPMADALVNCEYSGVNKTTLTDADGNYSFSDLPAGATFTITANSNVDPEKGITVYDVMKARCEILWLEQLNLAEAYIAADMNQTGGITTFDIVMQLKAILGENISIGYDVWQFVSNLDDLADDYSAFQHQKQYIVLEDLTTDASDQNFTAIKSGDIAPETNPTAANKPTFTLEIIDQTLQQLTVSLNVKDFEDISAGQFAIQWNNDLLEFADLVNTPDASGFQFEHNVVNGNLRMTFANMDIDPVTVGDGLAIAQLTFNILLPGGGFDIGFADDSVMPKVIVANNCELASGFYNSDIPSGDLSIKGKVLRPDGSPLPDVAVKCQFSTFSLETTTNADGNYEFQNLVAGASYNITASSEQNPEEGVTIFDIAKGACHILGINMLQNKDEFLAFDVNSSGSNTTFDLVNMRKLILGQEVGSSIAIWHFISNYDLLPNDFTALGAYETQITIDDLSADMVDQNFTAIKAGDIVPETNPTAAYDPNFSLEEVTINDQEVVLDLTVEDFENIRGIQFALEWDNNILEFADLEQIANPSPGVNLNWDFNMVNGKLRLVFQEYLSNDGLTFPDGTVLLRLSFNVLQLGDTEVAFADDSVMPRLVVANFCDLAGGMFNFTNAPIQLLSSTNDISLSGLTAHLQPNLTKSGSNMHLVIEAENTTNIKYRILNISGMEMQNGQANLVSGKNSIGLTSPELPGLYFVQIVDEHGRIGQLKLVVQ